MHNLGRKIIRDSLIGILISGLASSLIAHPEAKTRLNHLHQQISDNPSEQTLYLQRANVLIMAKHYAKASADLHNADALGPSLLSSYYKGLIHKQQHQYNSALTHFNQALLLQANNIRVLSSRAQVYIALNNSSAALSDYRQILQHTPAPQPSHYIDTAKLVLSLSDYQQALAVIDEGIQRLGLNPQLQQYAVNLCESNHDIQQALARHQSLHTMMRENPVWYFRHANLLIADKQWQPAQVSLNQAQYLLKRRKHTPWRKQLVEDVNERLVALESLSGS